MGEALKKAIIPSCICALFGIPFALVGAVLFFVLGLIVFTLGFYFYGKIKPKQLLSEYETIDMCKQYLDKSTDTINDYNDRFSPLKCGILSSTGAVYDDINNVLIYNWEYDTNDDPMEIVNEYRNILKDTMAKDDLDNNKMYIACVYVGASFIARIKNNKIDGSYDLTMTPEEMKSILSKWHTFGTEYSWI